VKAPQTAVLARAAILLAALALACLLLAACGSDGAPQAKAITAAPASTVSAAASFARPPGGIFDRVVSNPAVTVTGGRMFFLRRINVPVGCRAG
jgi:hypothetical protein